MSILEPDRIDPNNAEALAAVVADGAASGDWRAAAFLLEHHPQHRKRWGNVEQIRAAIDAELYKVWEGMKLAGMTLDEQRHLLNALQACRVGMPDPEDSADA